MNFKLNNIFFIFLIVDFLNIKKINISKLVVVNEN